MAAHIKNLLNTIISPQDNWKTKLLYNWRDIIGNLHEKVTIEKINNDTMVLGVCNSCWMQELYLLSPVLLKTINESLDQPRIKQLRFIHAGRKKQKQKKTTHAQPQRAQKSRALSPAEQKVLENITDPTLRKALEEFRMRCYQE